MKPVPPPSLAAENLRNALRRSMLMEELQDLQRVVRVLSVLLACITGYKLLVEPGMLILTTDASLMARAAVEGKHPDLVGWTLLLCAVAMVPYVVQQAIAPAWKHRRRVTQHAAYSLSAAFVMWSYLFNAAGAMKDVDALPVVLGLNAGCCLAFAAVLGISLNSELGRMEEGKCQC